MRRATRGCQKEILERLEKSRLVVVIRGFRGTNGGCPHRNVGFRVHRVLGLTETSVQWGRLDVGAA